MQDEVELKEGGPGCAVQTPVVLPLVVNSFVGLPSQAVAVIYFSSVRW